MLSRKTIYLAVLLLAQKTFLISCCIHGDLYPNLYDCRLFYQCSHGQLMELQCPQGLHFNPFVNVCDLPENSNCEAGTTLPDTTITTPRPSSTVTTSTTTLPTSTTTLPTSTTTRPTSTTTLPTSTTTRPTSTTTLPTSTTTRPTSTTTLPTSTTTRPTSTTTIPTSTTTTTTTTIAPQICQWEQGQEIKMGNRCDTPHGFFVFQFDGNAVIYDNSNVALWNTQTGGGKGHQLVFQTDGNLVMYSATGSAVWHSSTHNRGGSLLVFQQDRNFVIYNSQMAALWHTRTQVL